jgi:CheY-like chemotaxis protein
VKRVYVIDDEQSIVESVSMILESRGYEVGAQNDDKDVVDNVVAFGADLVIVDVMFPEDSGAGFEMARALKADERTRPCRMMLTAVNEAGSTSASSPRRTWTMRGSRCRSSSKPIVPEVLAKVQALCPTDGLRAVRSRHRSRRVVTWPRSST